MTMGCSKKGRHCVRSGETETQSGSASRQLGRCGGTAFRQGAIESQAVADVNGEHAERSRRGLQEPFAVGSVQGWQWHGDVHFILLRYSINNDIIVLCPKSQTSSPI